MQRLLSIVLGAVFALAVTASHAGVAPALGGGAQAMSGAKIAKPADATKASADEHKDEKSTEQKESTPKQ